MSEVGGYASRMYEHLENLAEAVDYAPHGVMRDTALERYLTALHEAAAVRTKTIDHVAQLVERRRQREMAKKAKARRVKQARKTNTRRTA